jgi:hypothetical protein
MTSLADEPKDELVSPPSDARSNLRLKWSLIGIVVGGICLLALGRQRAERLDRAGQMNGVRELGMALFEFVGEYGAFPDETTIDVVKANTGTNLKLGTETSNDFFRQLIASGIATNESMFYVKIPGGKMPDNRMDGIHALEKGEVGYAWFRGGSTRDYLGRPLIAAPMIPGTDRFDPKPFHGRAFIVKLDNSIGSLPIDENGHAILDGRNMMDPHHPVWNGHAPTIAWPEL